jgi:LPXTG-motif cell wall-anchored protein
MNAVWDFVQSYTFMGICAVLLLALIGVFFYVRKQQSED